VVLGNAAHALARARHAPRAARRARAQVRRLEAEVGRLRAELARARAAAGSSAGASARPSAPGPEAGPGPGWEREAAAQERATLAPAVPVPQLDFAVDQLICVGARSPGPAHAEGALALIGYTRPGRDWSASQPNEPGCKASRCRGCHPAWQPFARSTGRPVSCGARPHSSVGHAARARRSSGGPPVRRALLPCARARRRSPALRLGAPRRAGSPLGLFLALRHVDPRAGRGLGTPGAAGLMLGAAAAAGDGLPAARRLYHLYHPNDPVAYRRALG